MRALNAINFIPNAIMTAIVVIILAIKVAIVTSIVPGIWWYLDNYITVYLIFAFLDVLNYGYDGLIKGGRFNDE